MAAGGLAASAVVGVGLACQESLLFGDGLDGNAGGAEKGVALAEALVAKASFRHNRGLNEGSGGDSTHRRTSDSIHKNLKARLAKHDGENCGSVQDHFGRPFSSYKRSAWSTYGPLWRDAPRLAIAVRASRMASRLWRRRRGFQRSRMA